jgi:hypothetical protein
MHVGKVVLDWCAWNVMISQALVRNFLPKNNFTTLNSCTQELLHRCFFFDPVPKKKHTGVRASGVQTVRIEKLFIYIYIIKKQYF